MDARHYRRGLIVDNAWRWFFSGIVIGIICASLTIIVVDPAAKLGLRTGLEPSPKPAAVAPGAERTFILVVDEQGRVISQRTELVTPDAAALAPIAPIPAIPAGPDAPPASPTPPPPPAPALTVGKAVMAKVEQPAFLSARDGVAYVATRGLQLKKVDLKGAVSNQSVEGIRDLGGSRIADVDVIANGTLFALVVDGPLEWRLFRLTPGAKAWAEAASAGSTGWAADVVALSVTDGGAVYLSATDPGGVFRLEADMSLLRPWVEGGRALGIDSSGDDTRLLYAAPETNPQRAPEQIRSVLSGVAQSWVSSYGGCGGVDPAQARPVPLLPRDVALLPVASGMDAALVVDSNHVVWLQARFGEGRPLFGVPCESGNDATHLTGPRGVAVDNLGNVFISDTGNSRVVVLPKPGATPPAASKAKATPAAAPPELTPTPAPPVAPGNGVPAPLAFVDFGNPGACPPAGRCPEADVVLPPSVTVRAGDSVRFNIRAQSHQVAIYSPGTRTEHLDLSVLGGVTGTPGGGATVLDPLRRVALSPALPFQQPMTPEWDWDTRGLPAGEYLVICTFKPHLDTGMVGTVTIE